MIHQQDDGEIEIVTWQRFLEQLTRQDQEKQDISLASQQHETAQDLATYHFRVSFDFNIKCNDQAIRTQPNPRDIPYDLALLSSFLDTDQEKLLHMLAYTVAMQLAPDNVESFMARFLPQVSTESRDLFNKAIDGLCGDEYSYWCKVRKEGMPWGDILTVYTRELFKCFSAEFIKSRFEILGEDQ